MLNFRVYEVWNLVLTIMQQGRVRIILYLLSPPLTALPVPHNAFSLGCISMILEFPKGYFGKIIYLSRVSFLNFYHCLLLSRLPQLQPNVIEKNKNI